MRITDRVFVLGEADIVDGMDRGPRITSAAGVGARVGAGELALRLEARLGTYDLGNGGATAQRAGGVAVRYAQTF
jgi:hypothetical protein